MGTYDPSCKSTYHLLRGLRGLRGLISTVIIQVIIGVISTLNQDFRVSGFRALGL